MATPKEICCKKVKLDKSAEDALKPQVIGAVWRELQPTLCAMSIYELRAKCLADSIDPTGSSEMLKERIVHCIAKQSLATVISALEPSQENTESTSNIDGKVTSEGPICSVADTVSCTSLSSDDDCVRPIINLWHPEPIALPSATECEAKNWAGLSLDLLQRIISFVDGQSSGPVLSQVCKQWRLAAHQSPQAWSSRLPTHFSWASVHSIPPSVLSLANSLATCDPDQSEHRFYLPQEADLHACTSYAELDDCSDRNDSEIETTSDDSLFDPEDIGNRARDISSPEPKNGISHYPNGATESEIKANARHYSYGGVEFGPQTDVGLFVELCKLCPHAKHVHLNGLLPRSVFFAMGENLHNLHSLKCSYSRAHAIDFDTMFSGRSKLRKIVFERCDWVDHHVLRSLSQHCPELSVLEMVRCPWVGANSIALLATACPKLERIHVTGVWLQGIGLPTLFQNLSRLECLEMEGCYDFEDSSLAQLSANGVCPALRHLYIGCTRCSSTAIENFKKRRAECQVCIINGGDDL